MTIGLPASCKSTLPISAAAMEEVKGFVKPYDWTFTTDYVGTLSPGKTLQVRKSRGACISSADSSGLIVK